MAKPRAELTHELVVATAIASLKVMLASTQAKLACTKRLVPALGKFDTEDGVCQVPKLAFAQHSSQLPFLQPSFEFCNYFHETCTLHLSTTITQNL